MAAFRIALLPWYESIQLVFGLELFFCWQFAWTFASRTHDRPHKVRAYLTTSQAKKHEEASENGDGMAPSLFDTKMKNAAPLLLLVAALGAVHAFGPRELDAPTSTCIAAWPGIGFLGWIRAGHRGVNKNH